MDAQQPDSPPSGGFKPNRKAIIYAAVALALSLASGVIPGGSLMEDTVLSIAKLVTCSGK